MQACEHVHILLGATDTAVPRFRKTPRLQVRHSDLAQDQRRSSVQRQVHARHGVYRVHQGERCATLWHGGDKAQVLCYANECERQAQVGASDNQAAEYCAEPDYQLDKRGGG